MIVKVQGLNIFNKSCSRFDINLAEYGREITLDSLYFTFDSIYLFVSESEIFVYDEKINGFQELNNELKNFRILSVCTNTNYLWCLGFHDSKEDQTFHLFQYSNKHLVKKISLDLNISTPLSDLTIQSTDVNSYIFENNLNGLKCLYELRKKTDLNEIEINKENQLNESSTSCLALNQTLLEEQVSQFSCGKEHILFLTTSNKLYSFGLGTKGQLGLGKIENRYDLALIQQPQCTPTNKIVSIGAGGWHSGFIDSNGDCYMWGWNLNGQVSVDDEQNESSVFVVKPTKLVVLNELLTEVKFVAISLGSRHSALVDLTGNLYTFGWNKYGQLFMEQDEMNEEESLNFDKPIKIEEFDKTKVKRVKCGCWLTAISFD